MKLAKSTINKLYLLRKKNWSAPAIISAFILVCMIIVYSFETIGLLNKERNLDMRFSYPENLIKTTYRDLRNMHSDKFVHNQMNSIPDDNNLHLNKDFVMKKINIHSKKSKEIYIETINKILIEGAISQMLFENSSFNHTKDYKGNYQNHNQSAVLFEKHYTSTGKFYCESLFDFYLKINNQERNTYGINDDSETYINMIKKNNTNNKYNKRHIDYSRKENKDDILYFDM